ncbi:hypothetical protein AJ79_03073 [Helicocarpus griseus UAMH5409]|uniref:SUMO ligase SizA n=1 Tax=Helicocarpus griseus UAMH5409 TaxID=1447875 RepID=A0A2B7XZI2_9EURO|nr:hypothetical protein AJ79_03073 [Helicocarpus griseus UAMH5409]
MAATGQDTQADLQKVVNLVRSPSLLNVQLKDILRSENLPVSGVKAVLQDRVIERLERFFRSGQLDRYNQLKRVVYMTSHVQMPPTPTHSSPTYQQSHSAASPYTPQTISPFPIPMTPAHSFSTGRLSFKDSPFYSILEPLTPVKECKVRESTRDSVTLDVVLSQANAARLQKDPSLRVMVYCAADSGLTPYTKCDIAFPHQVELKANLDDVKANLRGLKNRPGSTRPADITDRMRKSPGFANRVKYFIVINLVQKHPVEELVKQLQARKIISAEQVIREMKDKAEDTDIVATSAVMSLKCPLSTLRIAVPCRSMICSHNQCFDATSFLQLQEQAPTWTCPVCNKSTSFESLQVDQYVDNILQSTPSTVDQVTVEPDGKWSIAKEGDDPTAGGNPSPPSDGEDDDLIEIQDSRSVTLKRELSTAPLALQATPSAQSREVSSVPSASRPTPNNNKRPASQVIDLTISDDEDEPPRPAKRPHIQSSSQYARNGYSDFNSRSNMANGNFGISSASDSNSPALNSYYYDA